MAGSHCGRACTACGPTGATRAGRPQVYGTQYGMTEAGFGPHPVEDPDGLDERRAAVGLQPMADYDAEMRRRAG